MNAQRRKHLGMLMLYDIGFTKYVTGGHKKHQDQNLLKNDKQYNHLEDNYTAATSDCKWKLNFDMEFLKLYC